MTTRSARNPFKAGQYFRFCLSMTLALMWGVPVGAVAIVLCVSVVGLPVGIPLLWVATWPFYHVQKRRATDVFEWLERDRPLEEGLVDGEQEEVPWVT